MNELQIFNNPRFGQIRTAELNGKVVFVASDVAKALGYAIPSKAVNTHCKGVSKMEVPTNGGKQEMLVISEGDIYRLTAKSELPGAEEFESWVFDELLPSIRKHGAYMTPQKIEEVLMNPDTIIQLATTLKEERERNKVLQTENKLLAQETLTWADRKVIEAIVKKIGASIGFSEAWREFKKELLYKHGINLNSRITNFLNESGKKTPPKTLDMIHDNDELQACISTAVALAKHNKIDIKEIISKFDKTA